jgi:hypothetical protein
MMPPTSKKYVRFKGTKTLKAAAQRQLTKFRDRISEEDKASSDFWNARVKNLVDDIDELNWDVDELSETEIWPTGFTERFQNIFDTIKRLGIDVKLENFTP